MASGAFTSGVAKMLDGTSPFLTTTYKVLLVSTTTPYTYNVDDDVVDAGGANDVVDAETNVAGYARGWGGAGRKPLASKTFAVNDATNRVEMDAADLTWTALGAGETLEAAVAVVEGGANDTTSQLGIYLDAPNVATNGQDVTLQFASGGLLNFVCG
jgi:hypothetical protein